MGAGTCAHPRPTPARDARWRHAATHLQASDRHRAVRRGQLLRARRVSPSKASSLHHLQGLWCWEIFLGDFVRIENSERSPRLVPYLYLGMIVVDPTTLLSAPQVLGGAGVMECMPKCRRGRRAVQYRTIVGVAPCSRSVQAQVAPIGKPQTTAANAKAATRPPCVCEMPRCTGKERLGRSGPRRRPLRSSS